MTKNLSPALQKNFSAEIFKGKLETFLICWKISSHLKENFLDKQAANFFEELSLNAINKTLHTPLSIAETRLFISELPKILQTNYPATKELKITTQNLILQLMNIFRVNNNWTEFTESEYILELLNLV